jgi:hypothetical protein
VDSVVLLLEEVSKLVGLVQPLVLAVLQHSALHKQPQAEVSVRKLPRVHSEQHKLLLVGLEHRQLRVDLGWVHLVQKVHHHSQLVNNKQALLVNSKNLLEQQQHRRSVVVLLVGLVRLQHLEVSNNKEDLGHNKEVVGALASFKQH